MRLNPPKGPAASRLPSPLAGQDGQLGTRLGRVRGVAGPRNPGQALGPALHD
jgi:hypothetical protein